MVRHNVFMALASRGKTKGSGGALALEDDGAGISLHQTPKKVQCDS